MNNAGIISRERRESADGYELTFAVNYLSHFLLTELLLPELREPARIVNVASIGQAPLDFDDPMFERGYDAYGAYAQSKLAQITATVELAERLGRSRHHRERPAPGHVDGHEDGARAARRSAELRGGGRGGDAAPGRRPRARRRERPLLQRHCASRGADDQAYDPEARRRLWELSERRAGLT